MSERTALLARQEELEAAGTAAGAERFQRSLKYAESIGLASSQGAAHQLLREGISALEELMRKAVDTPRVTDAPCRKRKTAKDAPANNKGRGYPMSRNWIQMTGSSTAAYLVLRTVIDCTANGQPVPVINLAVRITDALTDELRYRRFRAMAPALFDYQLNMIRRGDPQRMSGVTSSLDASMKFADIDVTDLELDDRERVKVGMQCLDMALDAVPWFAIGQEAQHKGKMSPKRVLAMRQEILDQLAGTNALLALARPVLGPMVVPPLPWGPNQRGGYRFALAQRHALITNVPRSHNALVSRAPMPAVYAALNAIQDTAWRINADVLATVQEIQSLGGGFAGLPTSTDTPLPLKCEDAAAEKERKQKAAVVRAENRVRRKKFDKVSRVVAVAEEMLPMECFYFPARLDFRGRIYCLASYLTYQGDDVARSLLTFADAKPVDATARRWLAIHGANMLGAFSDGRKVSQFTLDERVAYIESITQQIVNLATDPIGQPGLLLTASKPLQFLAFAFEWSGVIAAESRGVVYHSSLPIQMDGTANGLQHYAALTRDAVGAVPVNVLPGETPSDIYGVVATTVHDRLTDVASTDPKAAQWLAAHNAHEVLSRRLTKSPCMTFAYGSARFGFKNQMFEYLSGLGNVAEISQHFVSAEGEPGWRALSIACTYLAGIVQTVLRDTVVGAVDAMSWMQACAKAIATSETPVTWITPLGLPVRLPYCEQAKTQIRSVLGGKVVSCIGYSDKPKVHARKQISGLAPSLVHSLDATHCMMTVNATAERGVSSWQMIHDSYAVCPADAQTLARTLREQFVALYANDALADLQQQFAAQVAPTKTLPVPPSMGSLDIERVLQSDYFFA